MKTQTSPLRHLLALALLLLAAALPLRAEAPQLETIPDDPWFAGIEPVKAPAPDTLLLKPNDRLAIIGDSITEQKMYSRIIETYLTVCVPDLHITARQYGWSGEVAEGFLHRMDNDCLRFKPTIATLCYGMNDFRYRPYDEAIAQWYRKNYTAVVEKLKAAGSRVVLGSPGCVGKIATWVKSGGGTLQQQNISLCKFRNIDIDIAQKEGVRFADVYWPLFTGAFKAKHEYHPDYNMSGHDGVHPGWAGHLVMAYAYLHAMGLDGDLGTFKVDLGAHKATATGGHVVDSFTGNDVTITSRRYPFCATGPVDSDNSIRSGMTLVPFNQQLNRMMLIVRNGNAASYKITWGKTSKVYTADQLAKGVNLAADFDVNPFSDAFARVDKAVYAKQVYETKQIKQVFHGKEGRDDMNAAVVRTEAERAPLAAAIEKAMVPVTHTIRIEAQ